MHTILIIGLILAATAFYLSVGGFLGTLLYRNRKRAHNCEERTCYTDHSVGAFFTGVFWPLALPVIGGMLLGTGSITRTSRADVRRERELDEAKHQTALAQEQARAAHYLRQQEQALRIGGNS